MTEGVGSAMLFTAVFTLLPEWYPTKVSTIMVNSNTDTVASLLSCPFPQGLFELAGGLGFAVGPVIGGVLYQIGGFRLPFFAVGGFVLLFVIPCFILIRSTGTRHIWLSV